MLTAPENVSDVVHGFVQHCQAALGAFTVDDYVGQVTALWDALSLFPRPITTDVELLTLVVAISRLAAGFFQATRAGRTSIPRPSRAHVNALLRLIRNEYYSRDLTLNSIASRLRLSRSYLSRALARETQHSFPTHLNCIRLLAAVDKLRRGEERVAAVASAVGYRSSGELDRQFQRRFAMTPRQFERLIVTVPPDRLAM